jgi:molybdopterin/thiamine biosynthesis adenylyltransferase
VVDNSSCRDCAACTQHLQEFKSLFPASQHFMLHLHLYVSCKRSAAQAAAATLQAMNPLVKVTAAAGSTDAALSASLEPLTGQDLIIATGLPLGQLQQLNELARKAGANFMAGGASGPGGWFFVDLRQHSYVPTVRRLEMYSIG